MSKNENKTQPTNASVDDFLDSVEHPVRRADGFVLKDLMARLSGCPPVMWGPSIVGFDQYHYKYDSGREGDFLIIGFSPRKANISLYIMPGYGEFEDLLEKLGKHKMGKACLYVNKLADIDMGVLEQIILRGLDYMREHYETGKAC